MRDRIIKKCKAGGESIQAQSYAAMMNPLMKTPLKDLSADTQNAFKTMQAELNV